MPVGAASLVHKLDGDGAVRIDQTTAGLRFGRGAIFSTTADSEVIVHLVIEGLRGVGFFGGEAAGFNCVDGFDFNCDGMLGDFCAVPPDLAEAIAALKRCAEEEASAAAAETVAEAAAADAITPVSVPVDGGSASGAPLAVTGRDSGGLAGTGLLLIALGTLLTGLGARRHRRSD